MCIHPSLTPTSRDCLLTGRGTRLCGLTSFQTGARVDVSRALYIGTARLQMIAEDSGPMGSCHSALSSFLKLGKMF